MAQKCQKLAKMATFGTFENHQFWPKTHEVLTTLGSDKSELANFGTKMANFGAKMAILCPKVAILDHPEDPQQNVQKDAVFSGEIQNFDQNGEFWISENH